MMENKTKIDLKNKSIFITGVAGFIGSNLAKRLLSTVEGVKVVGLDNMNNYYDVRLKEARLKELEQFEKFSFVKGNLADKAVIESIFEQYKPEIVVNLGAQAGVRYSITNPDAYVEANLIGFYNILEVCRHSYDEGHTPVEHLVYASSSSVYGSNKKVPYSTDDKVDNPVSLYAATKKSNELMAHAYSKLYNIPCTGLRFFTVYGPAGRPDMAYFGFTNKLLKDETIQIFNYGNCKRDFTYVDDIVEGVVRVMQGAPARKNGEDGLPVPPYAVYNIGNQNPENLLDFVQILQEELIRAGVLPEDYDFEAHKKLVPMQPGDVPVTYADTSALERDFGYADAAGNTVIYMVPNYQIDGKTGTWLPYDSEVVEGVCFFMMRNEQRKDAVSPVVVDSKGVFVTDAPNGFENVRSTLTEYVQRAEKKQQDMTEHEKCLTNGTYERARESGIEQNYDMIDGCVNNVPKKPRRIGGRWSVLDRLHIKQAQRKQKDQTQQQQQERSRKN